MSDVVDAVFAEDEAAQPQPETSPADVVDQVFAEDEAATKPADDSDARLRLAREVSQGQQPERAAQVVRLSEKTGMAPQDVDDAFDDLKKASDAEAFDPAKLSPSVRKVLLERPELMPVVVGDKPIEEIDQALQARGRNVRLREEQKGILPRTIEAIGDWLKDKPAIGNAPAAAGAAAAVAGTAGPLLAPLAAPLVPLAAAGMAAKGAYEFATSEKKAPELRPLKMVEMQDAETKDAPGIVGSLKQGVEEFKYNWAQQTLATQGTRMIGAIARGDSAAMAEIRAEHEKTAAELGPQKDYGNKPDSARQLVVEAARGMASSGSSLLISGGGNIASAAAGLAVGAATKNPAAGATVAKAGRWLTRIIGFASSVNQEAGGDFWEFEQITGPNGERIEPGAAAFVALMSGMAKGAVEVAEAEQLQKLGGPIAKMLVGMEKGAIAKALMTDQTFFNMAKAAGRDWAKAGLSEGGEETIQSGIEQGFGRLLKTYAGNEFKPDLAGGVAEALEAGRQGAIGGLAMGGFNAPLHMAQQTYVRSQELEGGEMVDALDELARGSRLAKASPDAFAKVVAQATADQGKPVKAVYVDPAGLMRVFQDAPGVSMDEQANALMEDGAKRLATAIQTGSLLEVPVAEFVEKWSPKPLAQALIQAGDVTTRSWLMTPSQSAAQQEEINAEADAIVEQYRQEQMPEAESDAEREFQKRIAGMLREAQPDVAKKASDAIATVLAKGPANLMKRYGFTREQAFDAFRIGTIAKSSDVEEIRRAAELAPFASRRLAADLQAEEITAEEQKAGKASPVTTRYYRDAITGTLNEHGAERMLALKDTAKSGAIVWRIRGEAFKQANDVAGHEMGNKRLQHIVRNAEASGGALWTAKVGNDIIGGAATEDDAKRAFDAVRAATPASINLALETTPNTGKVDTVFQGFGDKVKPMREAKDEQGNARPQWADRLDIPVALKDRDEAGNPIFKMVPDKYDEKKMVPFVSDAEKARYKEALQVFAGEQPKTALDLHPELVEHERGLDPEARATAIYLDVTNPLLLNAAGWARIRELHKRDWVVSMDLADVKAMDQVLGHGATDNLLVYVGRFLSEFFTDNEMARLSGDEHALQGDDKDDLEIKIGMVRKRLAQRRFFARITDGVNKGRIAVQEGVFFGAGIARTWAEADGKLLEDDKKAAKNDKRYRQARILTDAEAAALGFGPDSAPDGWTDAGSLEPLPRQGVRGQSFGGLLAQHARGGLRAEERALGARAELRPGEGAGVGRARPQARAQVVTPGRSDSITYRVVEASSLVPSHNPETWQPRTDYPAGVQTRSYHGVAEEQAKVLRVESSLNPELVLSDNLGPSEGPPIVTSGARALVLGGNGRTMGLQLAMRDQAKRAAYREALLARADRFGLERAEIEGMRAPVLVRVADDITDTAPKATLAAAVTRFNETNTQAQTAADEAVGTARNLSPETIGTIGEQLALTEGSVREMLSGRAGPVVAALRKDGIITTGNSNKWLDERGGFTEWGKDQVEQAFLAKVLGSSDRINATSRELRAKVERAVPHLLRVAGVRPDFDEVPTLRQAVDLLNAARRTGMTLREYLGQLSLFQGPVSALTDADLIEIRTSFLNGDTTLEEFLSAVRDEGGDERLAKAAVEYEKVQDQFTEKMVAHWNRANPSWWQSFKKKYAGDEEGLLRFATERAAGIANDPTAPLPESLHADAAAYVRASQSLTAAMDLATSARRGPEVAGQYYRLWQGPAAPAPAVAPDTALLDARVAALEDPAKMEAFLAAVRKEGGSAVLARSAVEYEQALRDFTEKAGAGKVLGFIARPGTAPDELRDEALGLRERLLTLIQATENAWPDRRRKGPETEDETTGVAYRLFQGGQNLVAQSSDATRLMASLLESNGQRKVGEAFKSWADYAAVAPQDQRQGSLFSGPGIDAAQPTVEEARARLFGNAPRMPSAPADAQDARVTRYEQGGFGTWDLTEADLEELRQLSLNDPTQKQEYIDALVNAGANPATAALAAYIDQRLSEMGRLDQADIDRMMGHKMATEPGTWRGMPRWAPILLEEKPKRMLAAAAPLIEDALGESRSALAAVADFYKKNGIRWLEPGLMNEARKFEVVDVKEWSDKRVQITIKLDDAYKEVATKANHGTAGRSTYNIPLLKTDAEKDMKTTLPVAFHVGTATLQNTLNEARMSEAKGEEDWGPMWAAYLAADTTRTLQGLTLKRDVAKWFKEFGVSTTKDPLAQWTGAGLTHVRVDLSEVDKLTFPELEGKDSIEADDNGRTGGPMAVSASPATGSPELIPGTHRFYQGDSEDQQGEPANPADYTTDAMLARYFEPGRIVPSYAGHDEVLEFHPSTADKAWSVTVQAMRRNRQAEVFVYYIESGENAGRWEVVNESTNVDKTLGVFDTEQEARALQEELFKTGVWEIDPNYPRPRTHHTTPDPRKIAEVLGKKEADRYRAVQDSIHLNAMLESAETDKEREQLQERLVDLDSQLEHLFAADNQAGPRGWTDIARRGMDATYNIFLTKNADLSTALHEFGHIYLDVLGRLAQMPDAPPALKKDYETALGWMGVADHEELTARIREMTEIRASAMAERRDLTAKEQRRVAELVAPLEKWARGFENYLMEGEAPSPGLRGAFSRFAGWLKSIYKTARSLNADLNDEIRGVFDRLLATDEEIAAARRKVGTEQPMFRSPAEAGMNPVEWQDYLDARERETAHAAKAARLKDLRRQLAEKKLEIRAAEKGLRKALEAEYEALPARRAQALLRDGVLRDADGKVVAQGFSDETLDEAARLLGFRDANEMEVEAKNLPDKAVWRRRRLEDRARQELAGLVATADDLQEQINAGLHGDASAEALFAEFKALKAKAGSGQQVRLESIRQAARTIVQGERVGRLDVGGALRAERSAAEKALAAAAKGNFDQALVHKHRQLLNHFLWRERTAAREMRDRYVALAHRLTTKPARERLGRASVLYRDAVDTILEAVKFVRPRPTDGARHSLLEAVARMELDGVSILFEPDPITLAIQSGTADWRVMTVAEAENVFGALKQIHHAATDLLTAIVDGQKMDKDEVVTQLVDEARANLPARPPPPSSVQAAGLLDSMMSMAHKLDGELLKMSTIFKWLSGGDSNSMWARAIEKVIQHAKQADADTMKRVVAPIYEAMKAMPDEVRKHLNDDIDGKGLFDGHRTDLQPPSKRFELLAMALNSGGGDNPLGNRYRLLQGRQIGEEQLMRALQGGDYTDSKTGKPAKFSGLTAAEWDWVESVWEACDQLWPEARDLEERASGLAPKKIDAAPFVVKVDGKERTISGRYYPAVYDRRANTNVGERQAAQSIAGMLDGSFVRPGTSHSHLKSRASSFADVIALDLSAALAHLSQVSHDLAYREAIKSVGGLVLDERVQGVLKERLGDEWTGLFLKWLQDVGQARGNQVATYATAQGFTRLFRKLRSNMATATLGYAVDIAAGDLSNVFFAVAGTDLRTKHWAAGLTEYAKNPFKSRAWALEKSGELRFRQEGVVREFNNALGRATTQNPLGRNVFAWWKDNAFALMEATDAATATPIWIGRYRQGIADGLEEKAAIEAADAVVRERFPSHSAVDQAALLRDKGSAGSLVLFGGFFNVVHNAYRTAVHPIYLAMHAEEGRAGKVAKTSATAAAQILGIAIAVSAMGDFLTGRGPELEDGDDELERWLKWFRRKLLLAPLQSIPFADPIASWLSGKKVSARAAPSMAVVDAMGRALMKLGEDEDKPGRRAEPDPTRTVEAVLNAGAMLTGLPGARPTRAAGYVARQGLGYGEEDAILEYISSVIYGDRGEKQATTPLTAVQRLTE